MAKLYELTEAYADLAARLEDCETDYERENILVAIDQIGADVADKGEAYARMMKNAQADADSLEKEIKRLQGRKKAAENLVERLKNNMLFALAGATELHTSIGRWKVQLNNPSVQIIDETKVPEEFFVEQPKKLMNSLILAHWKETGEIPDGITHVEYDEPPKLKSPQIYRYDHERIKKTLAQGSNLLEGANRLLLGDAYE